MTTWLAWIPKTRQEFSNAGRFIFVRNSGVLRALRGLHLRIRESLNHGKHTCWNRCSGPDDLSLRGDAPPRKILSGKVLSGEVLMFKVLVERGGAGNGAS